MPEKLQGGLSEGYLVSLILSPPLPWHALAFHLPRAFDRLQALISFRPVDHEHPIPVHYRIHQYQEVQCQPWSMSGRTFFLSCEERKPSFPAPSMQYRFAF
ncbi:hypothetical protein OIU84_015821 [Salix udensis]|uniref:Uncharacterized protein n=1 Tax=Salix udensis TaxID=889485 RepID=A0AAD6J8G9_9ROSI|nr:hypothetical protein OIU84_015821 [Salix udensis]